MPHFDRPLSELRSYLPERDEPEDYDAFWDRTLSEQRRHVAPPLFEEVRAGYSQLVTEDVTFAGYGGEPIKAWLLRPRHLAGPLPTVVTYIGYGGGRGLLGEWTALPSAGFAHFVMDLRGQGSGHRPGDTADGALTGPHTGGFMTLGIESPDTYYYRRLFVDAVHAVEAAQAHPAVDPARVVVSGGSQGGGITLAAAALTQRVNDTPPVGAIVDVPFLAHMRHATEIVGTAPYSEIVTYLGTRRNDVEGVFRTLSYFDGVNFAARGTVPALFSVGLLDDVCPPSCVFAAHNHYAGPKRMKVYPYNGHEQGGAFQDIEHLAFVRELLAEQDALVHP
ncbi:acetylxylan esterase [Arthrobacter antioxidans]|uniref:acetylxylan esterase n=1 Tax=Arthrobacter antioxidans TaxID=2895818 RepID=UPI001FFFDA64|nr:acetylxylan esterase [Arthrobacter antioxidans]